MLLTRHRTSLVSALVLGVSFALGSQTSAQTAPSTLAPSFAVKDLDGKTVKLSDFKGKPVILDFWATWCQPCRAAMPHLNELSDRHAAKGLVVLGLSVDEGGPIRVRRFTDHMGIRFRIAMADERVLDQYGPIRSIPTTVFIDRRGQIVRRVVGYIDPEILDGYALELFGR